jgi:hypothetical protein
MEIQPVQVVAVVAATFADAVDTTAGSDSLVAASGLLVDAEAD